MFGTPENNNTELHSDTTSGDVSYATSFSKYLGTAQENIVRRRENEFY